MKNQEKKNSQPNQNIEQQKRAQSNRPDLDPGQSSSKQYEKNYNTTSDDFDDVEDTIDDDLD